MLPEIIVTFGSLARSLMAISVLKYSMFCFLSSSGKQIFLINFEV